MANELMRAGSDTGLTPAQRQDVEQIAKDEGIPVSGITILGGKPYINVTGLDRKLQNKCENEGLILAGIEYIPGDRAVKENLRASGTGIVRLFDKPGFEKALKSITNMTTDLLKELKAMYYYEFKMRGFCSLDTLKMSTMKNIDNIEMMTERRATNRAKREAVGTGLTSLDEMITDEANIKQAEQVVKPEKKSEVIDGDEPIDEVGPGELPPEDAELVDSQKPLDNFDKAVMEAKEPILKQINKFLADKKITTKELVELSKLNIGGKLFKDMDLNEAKKYLDCITQKVWWNKDNIK